MSRKRRRGVSPQTERDASRTSLALRLSLSENIKEKVYGDIGNRHKGAFDTRSLRDVANRIAFDKQADAVRRRKVRPQVQAATRDRRFFHPRKFKDFVGATRLGREAHVYGLDRLQHYAKDSAVICEQRKERREVLFASGKGGRSHKTPHRWTETSNRSCR